MKQYLDIVRHVLENGKVKKPVRRGLDGKWHPVDGGVSTIACANVVFSHDMEDGFPLLTTKKMAWKAIRVELEGFIKGVTDKRWFQEHGVHIWDSWSRNEDIPLEQMPFSIDIEDKETYRHIHGDELKRYHLNNPDLGPLGYSHGWRNFGGSYKPIPYIHSPYLQNLESYKQDIVKNQNKSNIVGQTLDTQNGKVIVIDYINKKNVSIIFLKTGYICETNLSNIKNGQVKDPYYPNIYGIACLGEYYKYNDLDKKLRRTWYNMITRCYCEKNKDYANYGGNYVYVANDWLNYSNFLRDVVNLPGWNKKLEDWNNYTLDKDILGLNKYSIDSCCWINKSEQSKNRKDTIVFKAIDKNNNVYISDNIKGFSKKYGLDSTSVSRCISGKYKQSSNWKFEFIRYKNKKNIVGEDQIKNIVETLLNNPMDRRMVCSAWNPLEMSKAALPSCHWGWNVCVIGDEINLVFHMRSVDTFLGMPFNIASYGLLLELLAKTSGLKAGNLSGTFADCHIYDNSIDACRLQLRREPKPLPRINITVDNIFDWTYKDVELIGYEPHNKIEGVEIVV